MIDTTLLGPNAQYIANKEDTEDHKESLKKLFLQERSSSVSQVFARIRRRLEERERNKEQTLDEEIQTIFKDTTDSLI